MTNYFRREIEPLLLNALANMPVVVVTGLRQVGKSTMLLKQPILKERRYISLDDFAQLEAAKRHPDAILGKGEPVTIDEAQRCPELLMAIKKVVDQRREPGRFLLSGSANFALLKGISETLAGRAIYLTLYPFTRREIAGDVFSKPFLPGFFKSMKVSRAEGKPRALEPSEIVLGGMPPVSLGQVRDPLFWFKGYEQTYLERDIRELSKVADLISFRHLLHLAALRTGQILKLSELGRDAKLNSATASRYLGLIEASFVIRRLFSYLGNRSSRLIKSPKIYLSDSGLACYLTGIESLDSDKDVPFRGAMIETYVAQNLAAILDAHWPQAILFYWGVQGRHEVDFIVEKGQEVLAIEVKAATHWENKDLSGLQAFLASTPHCRAAVLAYNGIEAVQLGERLWAIPLSFLLS